MKKLLSIFLTTAIIICSTGIMATASDTLMSEEKFTGLSTGDINGQNDWIFVNTDTVGTVSATIENDDGNNVLNMSRTAVGSENSNYDSSLKGSVTYAYKPINSVTMEYGKDYNIELKIKNTQDVVSDTDRGAFHIALLTGDGSDSTVAEDAINIKVVPKYNRLQYFYVDGSDRKSSTYDKYTTSSEWTTLRILYHCTKYSSGSGSDSTYDIYVNDTLAASAIPAGKSYRTRDRIENGTIKTIYFENPHDTVSEWMVDDIKISQVSEPLDTSGFELSDYNSQLLDNVTNDITLPTNWNGCSVTWSSSDSSIISDSGMVNSGYGYNKVTMTATISNNKADDATKSFDVYVVGENATLVQEDFSGMTVGNIDGQDGWNFVNNDTSGSASAEITEISSDKVLKLSRTQKGSENVDYDSTLKNSMTYVYKDINDVTMPYDSDYKIDIRFKNNLGASDTGTLHYRWTTDDGIDVINIKILPKYNRLQVFYVDGVRNSYKLDKYTTNGEWTVLSLVYHNKYKYSEAVQYSNATIDAYMNGILIQKDIPACQAYTTRAKSKSGTLGKIYFENPHDSVGEWLIDNISVKRIFKDTDELNFDCSVYENGAEVLSASDITTDTVSKFTVSALNPGHENENFKVFIASYNDNKLYDIVVSDVNELKSAEIIKRLEITDSLSLPTDKTNCKIKAFFWRTDSFNLFPLATPCEF